MDLQIPSILRITELSPGSSSGGGSGSNTSHNGPARSRDRNERGETAMHVAAIKGDQDGIKKLLEQGMSPNVADFAGNKRISKYPFNQIAHHQFIKFSFILFMHMK